MKTRLTAVILAAAGTLTGAGCEFIGAERSIEHYVRGQILADQGKLDQALAELARAVEADPTLSIAHCAMGDIHRRQGNYNLARHSYEKSCQANPYAFRPHYNLGVVYQFLADAAQTYAEAQELLRKAVEVYVRAVTIEPDDFEANLNLSACYFSLGKHALAEKYCKAAIAVRSDRPEAYGNLGIIYDEQGRLYEAIKAYKDSLELNVHQPKLLLNLGSTYMRQRRLKSALEAFELALREEPDSADAHEQIGTCRYHMKQYAEALGAYEKAVSLNRNSAGAYRGIGVVRMTQYLLAPGQSALRDEALKAWHMSLELEPDQADIVRLVRKYTPKPVGSEL